MVLLSEIAEALTTTDGFDWYYDRADDKVLMMATYDSLPEDDELQDAIEEDTTGRYIRIDDFEGSNRGWDCMARFAASKDGDVRYRLERAINGRGAFRMFKDTVEDLRLLDEWRRFEEDDELRRAMDWCDDNDVPYDPPAPRSGEEPESATSPTSERTSPEDIDRMMESPDKAIEELTFILLYLTSTKDRYEGYTSWKGYDFGTLDRLEEKGLIGQGRNKYKSKSVWIPPESVEEARRLLRKYGIQDKENRGPQDPIR